MYGTWMYDEEDDDETADDEKLRIEFPEKLVEECIEFDEEKLLYPQFFINLEVAYFCGSDHEYKKKKLLRYSLEQTIKYSFKFPTSYLKATLKYDDDPYHVLALEMDDNVPLVGLTFEDKVDIVSKFVAYVTKSKKVWSRKRWVQVNVSVVKTTKMVSCVDFQTMLQETKDKEYHLELDKKIKEMVKTRVHNNEDIASLDLWSEYIKDLVGHHDQHQITMPFNLEERCRKARKEAVKYGMALYDGLGPASATEVCELEKRKVSVEEMNVLDECVLCEERMFLGQEATTMPCSHVFHTTCIESWLKVDFICPLCRDRPTQEQRQASCPAFLEEYHILQQRYL